MKTLRNLCVEFVGFNCDEGLFDCIFSKGSPICDSLKVKIFEILFYNKVLPFEKLIQVFTLTESEKFLLPKSFPTEVQPFDSFKVRDLMGIFIFPTN